MQWWDTAMACRALFRFCYSSRGTGAARPEGSVLRAAGRSMLGAPSQRLGKGNCSEVAVEDSTLRTQIILCGMRKQS